MLHLKKIKRDFDHWSWLTLIIVIFVSIPLLALIFKTFSGPGESWSHLVKTILGRYTLNSIWLVVGVSFFTLLFGVPSAWIVSRYHFYGKKMFEWLLILPLTIPSYITAYAYAGIFDYGGTVSTIFGWLGIEGFKIDIMNIYGLIFILSISLYPYVYVASRAVFMYQSGRLIEASNMLGASNTKTLFKIVLPIARPAIIGGLLLVIMEVFNDYGAAKYFGVNTLTTGVFRAWFSLEEPNTAVFISLILLLLVLIFVLIERWQRGNKGYQMMTKSDIKLKVIESSKSKKWIFTSVVFMPVFLGFITPVFQLLKWLSLTWENTFSMSYANIALQSVGISLTAAMLTVLFGLLIIYFPKWNRINYLQKSSNLATVGYAIPGAVLAIGVMIPAITFDRWLMSFTDGAFLINGTIFILVYAYIIRFLAVSFKPLQSSQLKIGKSLSESSLLLGKSTLKTFFNIDVPLIKTGIFSAVLLVFVDMMKELPLTLILKPYNVNTLAVKAFEYASDELIMESALPALTIIATGLLPILFLNRLLLNKK